ncbi:sulfate adenylyltransferase subunit CysD [candidate division KSB1 bacterium]|nr:sulfate adenylyltransferase subunit CysD [candidate division KSB1 bacterium]
MPKYSISYLKELEAESIFIMREVVAEFENPVMLYSIGKDSSVMVRLAQKAFYPAKMPFPFLHIDTSFKFPEMIAFRDKLAKDLEVELIVHSNSEALAMGMNPWDFGTEKCCQLLKTQALLDALRKGKYDAAFGGARRDEEKSRAKERVFSFRNSQGQWDPKNQRPELWNLFNSRIDRGESIRVFPLSNWTELDVWQYIMIEKIPVVPLYFAQKRKMIVRGDLLIPLGDKQRLDTEDKPRQVNCRFRTLGCYPCTGAVRSEADTVEKIIEELKTATFSERFTRIIDYDSDGSMELKKREGYF